MVATRNNNDAMAEQMTMIQILQAQMEELRQKGMEDHRQHEEDRRLQEEDRRRQEEEIALLREQNARLQQQVDNPEREGQSHMADRTASRIPTPANTNPASRAETVERKSRKRGHPFTDEIITTPLPDKWRGLVIKLYDGSTDPDEHLNVYKTQMTLYTTDNNVWCKVFPTSLQGEPLTWFTELPPNSINDFDTLAAKFSTQYATSRPHHMSSMSLLAVQQEKGESLRTFLDRFNKACMNIRGLKQEVALHHLVSAIRPSRFTESLIKKPPQDMEDLRTRATKFMQIEEHIDYHQRFKAVGFGALKDQTQSKEREVETERTVRTTLRSDRNRGGRIPRFNSYTPLTVPRGRALDEALQTDLIPTLKQYQTPPNADTAKRCQYHQNFGHTTEGCQALKDKIEELIQAGHLRQFVKRTRSSRSPPRNTDRPSRGVDRSYRNDYKRHTDRSQTSRKRSESPVRRTRPRSTSPDRNARPRQRVREVINMIAGPVNLGEPNHETNYIAGGFAGGGCSNSARKKHLRDIQSAHATTRRRPHIPPITFTDEDYIAIDPAQDDPMVITVEIDKFAIAKTLVDQGSSVDILYWDIFKKMRIPEAHIQPYNEQIVGFSGERVDTKGYIDLYTTFGEEDGLHKTINVRYLLVNAQTSYNILLGRPSINRLKAIVSTPHLAMKFPSANNDIATIHVDQKTARECYVASLKSEPTRRLYTTNTDDRVPQKRGRSPTRRSGRHMSRRQMIALVDLDPRMDDPRMEAGEDLHPFPLRDDRHTTHIGTSLKPDDRMDIGTTLVKNSDLFAWTAADMPGVDPQVITHRLSLYREAKPIAQKKRHIGEERRQAAREEADKLLQAGFIRQAHYTTWLANVVMVKKANGKWRMCVDYTDLNKALLNSYLVRFHRYLTKSEFIGFIYTSLGIRIILLL
ncbi:uncharacterized protein [Phaseolus vulgaris]|uniref:uncharacterized protein n=1 Tax=Phaseolus vulgaris TaxID=3885 RepID=UPI0035CACBCE